MDYWKPAYHFRPEKNWMNDPNGPIYYQGEYHLFFQYNPNGDQWGTIHWGHAKSRNLLHWEMCQNALTPKPEWEEIHCYSGCAFLEDGIPTIYYTSVGAGKRGPEEGALQCGAISRDGMMSWERLQEPVLNRALHESRGVHIAMWRDPFVWQEEDGTYALLGGTLLEKEAAGMEEIEQGQGCLALYHKVKGGVWEFKNILMSSKQYYLLECPNMIPFGEQYLLLYSPLDAVRYCIGTLDKTDWTFHVQKEGVFDHSIRKCGFYAPNTYLNDPCGRKIVIGWLSEADRAGLKHIRGWAGMQSVPRQVRLERGQLFISPVEEALGLRQKMLFSLEIKKEENKEENKALSGLLARGRALEICLSGIFREEGTLELGVFAKENGREETIIRCSRKEGGVTIDRTRSSLFADSVSEDVKAKLEPCHFELLCLRIYLDHSSLEIFVNDRVTLTARVYPSEEKSDGVYLRCMEGVELKELTIWELGLSGIE